MNHIIELQEPRCRFEIPVRHVIPCSCSSTLKNFCPHPYCHFLRMEQLTILYSLIDIKSRWQECRLQCAVSTVPVLCGSNGWICVQTSQVNLRRAGVSSQVNFRWVGGGGAYITPCLTSELIGRARSARRRAKVLNKGILMQF